MAVQSFSDILTSSLYLLLNFVCSEKTTKFCEIFTLLFLQYVKVKISRNFVAILRIYEFYEFRMLMIINFISVIDRVEILIFRPL